MARKFVTFSAASSGARFTSAPKARAAATPAPQHPAPPPPDLAKAIKDAPFDRSGRKK